MKFKVGDRVKYIEMTPFVAYPHRGTTGRIVEIRKYIRPCRVEFDVPIPIPNGTHDWAFSEELAYCLNGLERILEEL